MSNIASNPSARATTETMALAFNNHIAGETESFVTQHRRKMGMDPLPEERWHRCCRAMECSDVSVTYSYDSDKRESMWAISFVSYKDGSRIASSLTHENYTLVKWRRGQILVEIKREVGYGTGATRVSLPLYPMLHLVKQSDGSVVAYHCDTAQLWS